MRRLAIPLGAIVVAIAAWLAVGSALAGGAAQPSQPGGAYPRHRANQAAAPAAPQGPRVDAQVRYEPPGPVPEPFVPAPAAAPAPKRPVAGDVVATSNQPKAPKPAVSAGRQEAAEERNGRERNRRERRGGRD